MDVNDTGHDAAPEGRDGVSDTPSDTRSDAVSDVEPDAVADVRADGSDFSDGTSDTTLDTGPSTCDYLGLDRGVCQHSQLVGSPGPGARDAGGGDATLDRRDVGVCLIPDDYEPTERSCDGLDNDCDGQTDENLRRSCGRSTGSCSKGTETCQNGRWGSCQGKTPPGSEVCNGKDDDCDGGVDENCPCVYHPNRPNNRGDGSSYDNGICRGQTIDSNTGTCTEPQDFEGPDQGDETNNSCGSLLAYEGNDNDCDGKVDEGCDCIYDPDEGPEYVDTDGDKNAGVCPDQTIGANGKCSQPIDFGKKESVNDDLDNDCDGTEDEDTARAGEKCSVGEDCDSGRCINFGSTRKCAHRVFITDDTWAGDLGGVKGADQKGQNAANKVGLEGTWKAILSQQFTNAKDRIDIKLPQNVAYTMNDEKMADDIRTFWTSSLQHKPRHDENGTYELGEGSTPLQKSGVWTGTNTAGRHQSPNCQNWTSADRQTSGTHGNALPSARRWLYVGKTSCDTDMHLYCIDGQESTGNTN